MGSGAASARTRLFRAALAWVTRGIRTRFARDRQGTTAVEFALLAAPFFAIVFALLETSIVFLAELTLDHAVDRVGRQVRTGEIQDDMSAEDFQDRICDDIDFLMDCDNLVIDLRSYADYADIPATAPVTEGDLDSSGLGYAPGSSETIMALRAYYKWPLYTDVMHKYLSNMSDGSFLIASMAAFKTEPYGD
ncbi:TadE/TadG family type IV pilus assembly protein [Consotaella aegiceratis]|uniref:TadE/TadG family type IV pilus assembly protein n=1 Tax=Consotaella aegiceratis TaxID=3097961 RepID=UPI002F414259